MRLLRVLSLSFLLCTGGMAWLKQGVCQDMSGSCYAAAASCAGSVLRDENFRTTSADSAFLSMPIPDSVFARMQGRSFPKGCTVKRDELRYLRVLHYDFEGKVRRGEIVCNRMIAQELLKIFKTLYEKKYPIHSIRLIDDFEADDERSMQANNTSCFCFRSVAGKGVLSKHARGLAIDINPLLNPCVRKNSRGQTTVQPKNAREYTDRKRQFRGKITTEDICYRLFREAGFKWGGSWRTLKDYQHFEK